VGHRSDGIEGNERLREARATVRELRRFCLGPRGEGRWKLVLAGVGATYRWAREAMAQAHERGEGFAYRRWRTAVRYHTLHLRMLAQLSPSELEGRLEVLQRLSELLAQDQALSVFVQCTSAVEQRHQALRALARPLGRRLFGEAPVAFCRRLQRCWQPSSERPPAAYGWAWAAA
jgi:hypothetical protein